MVYQSMASIFRKAISSYPLNLKLSRWINRSNDGKKEEGRWGERPPKNHLPLRNFAFAFDFGVHTYTRRIHLHFLSKKSRKECQSFPFKTPRGCFQSLNDTWQRTRGIVIRRGGCRNTTVLKSSLEKEGVNNDKTPSRLFFFDWSIWILAARKNEKRGGRTSKKIVRRKRE